jgi:glycosyltransferase involved in cell wall biosynthesis
MSKYKLSVIIPTFNTGVFLHESLGSIINQSIGFENVEVILVDDKSSDPLTLSIIDDYVSKYSNIKVIYLEENSGFPGRPRNVGIDASTSDYVIVMDHDDSYEIDAFEHLYNTITKENADVVICNFNQVFKDGSIPFKSLFGDVSSIKVENIEENKKLLQIPAAIWTRLFRKSFLKKHNIRFLEGMLAEDVYVGVNSLLNAKGIVYLNSYYGYNYKTRDTAEDKSTIHIRNKKYIDAILNGFLNISSMIEEQNKEKYSDDIFKPHLTSWLYTIVLSNTNKEERKQLFKKASNLYKKRYVDDPYFKGRYNKLVNYILNNQFDQAVNESIKLQSIEENMNVKLVNEIKENNKLINKTKNKFKKSLKKIFKN